MMTEEKFFFISKFLTIKNLFMLLCYTKKNFSAIINRMENEKNIIKEFISHSEEETFSLASEFEKTLKGGEVVLLSGDLGAGKTTFTKGLAKALNITENITSPTFTLMNIYTSGRLKLYHFDMYRLEDESEAIELGLDEFFNSNGVCMIEWAENIKNMIPKNHIVINIEKLSDNERKFVITKVGE